MTHNDELTERRLSRLGGRVRGVSWPEPAEIKSRARRRLHRRAAGLAGGVTAAVAVIVVVALAALAVGPLGGHGAAGHGRSHAPTPRRVSIAARSGAAYELVSSASRAAADPAAAVTVESAEQTFGLKLLQRVAGASPDANVTVSPESLAIALAMLETGARGQTEKQIASTLRTASLTAAQQDAGWATLTSALGREATSGGFALHSADSLWIQDSLPMVSQFMADMASYFSSGVWRVDFAGHFAAAEAALNAWVSKQTAGNIPILFAPGDLPRQTLVVLANAVYLDAPWQHPFDAALSAPGQFHVSPSETSTVTFMDGPVPQAASTSGYQLAVLPYKGGQLQAVAVSPTSGSLDSFLSGLTSQRLASMISSANQPGTVLLPRFATASYANLNQTLKAMGMPLAFDVQADFSGMSSVGLNVASAVQRDYLDVGEKGTEAAAASGIAMAPVSAHASIGPRINLDHPFLFLIRDASTGTILFASEIRNPAAS